MRGLVEYKFKKPKLSLVNAKVFSLLKYCFLTSKMCSRPLASYLVLYILGSFISPLVRSQVTTGGGAPLTIALKRAFLPFRHQKAEKYFFFL